jgi:peptidyl-prolyl cis-trans isomerase C
MRTSVASVGIVIAAAAAMSAVVGCGRKAPPAGPAPTGTPAPVATSDLFTAKMPPAGPSPADVIVTVNTVPIRRAELEQQARMMWSQVARQVAPEQQNEVQQQIVQAAVQELINRQLLLQESEALQVPVDAQAVADARRQFESQVPPGRTLAELLAAEGRTIEALEADIARELRLRALLDRQLAAVPPPTGDDIKAFYEQSKDRMKVNEAVTARHILIGVKKEDDAAAREQQRAKAEDIRRKLVEGADFAGMVTQFSDDPGSKQTGGKYTFSKGEMTPAFEQAAFTQTVNEIGPVVETPFGYHVIQVIERTAEHAASLEEAREAVSRILTQQRRQQAVQAYLTTLRGKARIEAVAPRGPPAEGTTPPAATPAAAPTLNLAPPPAP